MARVKDTGWTVKVSDVLSDLEAEVEVGWFSEENASKAYFNEYGTVDIPSRPFVRTTFDTNERQYLEMISDRVDAALDGQQPSASALVSVANQLRNDLIRSIQQWSSPPNKSSTVREKGAANPLVDTGEMMRSIEVKVIK